MKAILSSEEKEMIHKTKKTYKAIKPTNIKRCIYVKSIQKNKQNIFLLSCGGALQPANLNTSMINI